MGGGTRHRRRVKRRALSVDGAESRNRTSGRGRQAGVAIAGVDARRGMEALEQHELNNHVLLSVDFGRDGGASTLVRIPGS